MDWKTHHSKDVNFLKSLYKINEIPIKIPAGFFGGYRQNYSPVV